MNAKEIIKTLKQHGWVLDRINGSHHIMIKEGFRPVPIPVHGAKDVPKSLVSALERQTGVALARH